MGDRSFLAGGVLAAVVGLMVTGGARAEEAGQPAVGRLWDAFLRGEEDGWPDFEHAVRIHGVVEGVRGSARDGRKVEL